MVSMDYFQCYERQGENSMTFRDTQIILHVKRYCLDIKEALVRCSNDYEQFLNDTLVRHAISMCIMQVGEFSGRLSDEFKDQTKNRVMWGAIRSMRNWFAHEYTKMDISEVWESATRDIPSLLAFCDEIIGQNPDAFKFPDKPEDDE